MEILLFNTIELPLVVIFFTGDSRGDDECECLQPIELQRILVEKR